MFLEQLALGGLLVVSSSKNAARGAQALVVMRGGAVVGMVTPHSVGELLTMRQAARARAPITTS